jgi:hypothetical protein
VDRAFAESLLPGQYFFRADTSTGGFTFGTNGEQVLATAPAPSRSRSILGRPIRRLRRHPSPRRRRCSEQQSPACSGAAACRIGFSRSASSSMNAAETSAHATAGHGRGARRAARSRESVRPIRCGYSSGPPTRLRWGRRRMLSIVPCEIVAGFAVPIGFGRQVFTHLAKVIGVLKASAATRCHRCQSTRWRITRRMCR